MNSKVLVFLLGYPGLVGQAYFFNINKATVSADL